MRQQGFGHLGVALEGEVVIARNDYLVLVRQGFQPFGKVGGLVERALAAEISCVNEHIAVGDIQKTVLIVGIRQADKLHSCLL